MDYNENFRLFMVTRNPNPELPPDASALVCEVNFTVTRFAQSETTVARGRGTYNARSRQIFDLLAEATL